MSSKPASVQFADAKGKASRLVSEGSFAIGVGQTETASEKYQEAGRILESDVASATKAGDKHLLLFLAATQYYLGGRYADAKRLANRIEARHLPVTNRIPLSKFLQDVRTRSRDTYIPRMRKALTDMWQSKQYSRILEHSQRPPLRLSSVNTRVPSRGAL